MAGIVAGRSPRARRAMALLVAGGFAFVSAAGGLPPRALAQPAPAATGAELQRLSLVELEQLLAPIALYPDQLLMQVLMASTYPLEVVQAQRWLAQGRNATLGGAALERALVAQPWDPAVKSLVPFPQVLALMSEQLDWTQRLGDAVLGQQAEVLDTRPGAARPGAGSRHAGRRPAAGGEPQHAGGGAAAGDRHPAGAAAAGLCAGLQPVRGLRPLALPELPAGLLPAAAQPTGSAMRC